MNTIYFLHALSAQFKSIKSLLLCLSPASLSEEVQELLTKYDDLVEEIAEAVVEINNEGG